jgi:CubicO group peptidase (beta-lactamase class C family)
MFKIASNSKAMTATLLARLVQAGKLRVGGPGGEVPAGVRLQDPG